MNWSLVRPVVLMLFIRAVNSASPAASSNKAAFASSAVVAPVTVESINAVMSLDERVFSAIAFISASTNSLAVICAVTLTDKIMLTAAAVTALSPAATRIFWIRSSFEVTEAISTERMICINSILSPANANNIVVSFSLLANTAGSIAKRVLIAMARSASPPAIRFIKASIASVADPTAFRSMFNLTRIKSFTFSKSNFPSPSNRSTPIMASP